MRSVISPISIEPVMRRLVVTFLLLGCSLVHAAELPETDWLDLMPKSDQIDRKSVV